MLRLESCLIIFSLKRSAFFNLIFKVNEIHRNIFVNTFSFKIQFRWVKSQHFLMVKRNAIKNINVFKILIM